MERGSVKKCKKTLDILEIAARDKENLSSRIPKKKMSLNNPKSSFTKKNKKHSDLDNKTAINNKNKKDQSLQTTSLVESDLTVDNPSEGYWQNLAESCRKALDSALKENLDLHNKVNELEYENSRLKAMLDEAKALVEVLTEMIQETNDESNETACQDVLEESTQVSLEDSLQGDFLDESTAEENQQRGLNSDSDVENMSFQSCL